MLGRLATDGRTRQAVPLRILLPPLVFDPISPCATLSAMPSAHPFPPPPPPATRAQTTPVAVLRGVTKRFGDVTALCNLDLELPRGVVGVLGPNGAGKSTLFRLLLGLEDADEGQVDVLGEPLPDRSLAIRARVGYMPEDDCLFPDMNGIGQVVHAARLCGVSKVDAFARAHQALDLVGLSDARYRLGAGFSLGMRQRLRLAMAVVHGPALLLLDEPTAGLDPEGRVQMLDLIREIGAAGVSVLLSTHVLADVETVCDQVALLSRGQVGFTGPLQRFRAAAGSAAYRVGVVGEATRLQAALQVVGLTATVEAGDLLVELPEDTAARFWQAAAESGVGIRSFATVEEDMAHAFVRHLRLDDPLRRQGLIGPPPGAAGGAS